MQISLSKTEKRAYGLIALLAVVALSMWVEYRHEPMAKTADVASYATQRFSQDKAQSVAHAKPAAARIAKAPAAKPNAATLSPVASEHVVAKGDTCYNIAKRYGGEVNALRSLNGLDAQCTLHTGQRLTVARK